MARVRKRAQQRVTTARRAQIAVLYARYCSENGSPNGVQLRIAKELNVDPAIVCKDLKRLNLEWQEKAQDAVAELKARMIADIERDLAEAREEWLRSRTDTPTEDTIEGTPGADGKLIPERMQRKKRSAAADTRYLAVTTAMREQLAKLIGLNAPQKVAPTTPDGQHAYDPGLDYRAELERRLAALAARRAQVRSDAEP